MAGKLLRIAEIGRRVLTPAIGSLVVAALSRGGVSCGAEPTPTVIDNPHLVLGARHGWEPPPGSAAQSVSGRSEQRTPLAGSENSSPQSFLRRQGPISRWQRSVGTPARPTAAGGSPSLDSIEPVFQRIAPEPGRDAPIDSSRGTSRQIEAVGTSDEQLRSSLTDAVDATPQGLYAQAEQVACEADSLGDLSGVTRLCGRGLEQNPPQGLAVSLHRLSAWAYNRRGELHAAAGRDEAAMNDFQAAIRHDPQCALAIHNRAVTFAQRGLPHEALRDFEQVIRINPGLAIAYRNRGELLASMGRTEEAVSDYCRAIAQLPGDADLFHMRGHALHRLRQYERALADLNQSIELAPNRSADVYTHRGNVQAELGRFKLAMRDFQHALRINPQWADAHRSEAWLLATCPNPQFRDPQKAIEAAQRAERLADPGDCFVLDAKAAAYASAGLFDEAVRNEQRAVDTAPEEFGDQLRERLALYKQRRPFRVGPDSSVQTASHEERLSTAPGSDVPPNGRVP